MVKQLDARVIMGRLQRSRKPEKDWDRAEEKRKADSEVSSPIGSVKTKPRSQVRKIANVIQEEILNCHAGHVQLAVDDNPDQLP